MASVLVAGNFLREVVMDTLLKLKRPWQVAHELFLLYLEKIETTPGDAFTLSNVVFAAGGQDTLLIHAEARAKMYFNTKGIFRPGESKEENSDSKGKAKPWNGQYNRDPSAKVCLTYNMGDKPHPPACLNNKGACKFAHVCDHWVTDKGPKGMCRSPSHIRSNCDNSNRCDEPVG